jgi:catechol 2,3-dioxygenase-like lactoylglutathione lyase family enzyme
MSFKCISIYAILATIIWAPTGSVETIEQPIFDVAKQDLLFRRTTIIVRDIEKSLMLYRDALGMEVIYDQILNAGDNEQRLIFLKTKEEYVGILALYALDYGNPDSERNQTPILRRGFVPQSNILIFNTDDLDGKWKRVIQVPGIEILREPSYREYPSYDGSGIIKVNVSIIYDPDGNMVELNQLLSSIT